MKKRRKQTIKQINKILELENSLMELEMLVEIVKVRLIKQEKGVNSETDHLDYLVD